MTGKEENWMSKQKFIVIDVSLCHDCNNCFMACKDEHVGNRWAPYTDEQPRHGHRWVNILSKERGQCPRIDVAYLPVMCQHCEKCPLVDAGFAARREDGIVLIDMEKAKGRKDAMEMCPYGSVYYNDEADVPQKCTMCAHIMDCGQEPCMPRCVHSCPTEAMKFYELEPDEMAKKIEEEKLDVYRAELGTMPHVFYKNLYRFEKAFIAGGIVKDDECAEGVTVTLKGNGVETTDVTDYFGDFKFDALQAGTYTLEIEGKTVKTVELEESQNVGSIFI